MIESKKKKKSVVCKTRTTRPVEWFGFGRSQSEPNTVFISLL